MFLQLWRQWGQFLPRADSSSRIACSTTLLPLKEKMKYQGRCQIYNCKNLASGGTVSHFSWFSSSELLNLCSLPITIPSHILFLGVTYTSGFSNLPPPNSNVHPKAKNQWTGDAKMGREAPWGPCNSIP